MITTNNNFKYYNYITIFKFKHYLNLFYLKLNIQRILNYFVILHNKKINCKSSTSFYTQFINNSGQTCFTTII